MKIIQVNIWGGKLGQQIVDFLRAEQPDFVCMQEVNDLKGRSGGKLFATLDELKAAGGFSDTFMSPTYSFHHMQRELEYGNAILSKFPLTTNATIFTEGKYKRNYDVMNDGSNIRNLQHIIVSIDGKSLHILNHHGHHEPGSKAGNEETAKQMRIIADEIDKTTGPLIFCGDLNLAPNTPSLAVLNDKLTNLSVVHKLQNTYSQFNQGQVVCDYIFVNDQIKVQHFEMSEALISDHKALVLEFEL